MSLVSIFNMFEAAWWIALGAIAMIVRTDHPLLRYRRSLAATLVIFGISDIVELWSGAWWRPLWLGVLKVTCGLTIAFMVLYGLRSTR